MGFFTVFTKDIHVKTTGRVLGDGHPVNIFFADFFDKRTP
jgi:hypothetical protein